MVHTDRGGEYIRVGRHEYTWYVGLLMYIVNREGRMSEETFTRVKSEDLGAVRCSSSTLLFGTELQ